MTSTEDQVKCFDPKAYLKFLLLKEDPMDSEEGEIKHAFEYIHNATEQGELLHAQSILTKLSNAYSPINYIRRKNVCLQMKVSAATYNFYIELGFTL